MLFDNEPLASVDSRRRPGRAVVALAVLTVALIVAVAATAWVATRPRSTVAAAPVPLGVALDPPEPPQALVFVSGAVAQPGLYRLSTGARLADAIAAAGGITADADPGRLPNLSARIHDGRQVNVPFLKGRGGSNAARGAKLDLNVATVDELRAVPGMPAGLPAAILDAPGADALPARGRCRHRDGAGCACGTGCAVDAPRRRGRSRRHRARHAGGTPEPESGGRRRGPTVGVAAGSGRGSPARAHHLASR